MSPQTAPTAPSAIRTHTRHLPLLNHKEKQTLGWRKDASWRGLVKGVRECQLAPRSKVAVTWGFTPNVRQTRSHSGSHTPRQIARHGCSWRLSDLGARAVGTAGR